MDLFSCLALDLYFVLDVQKAILTHASLSLINERVDMNKPNIDKDLIIES